MNKRTSKGDGEGRPTRDPLDLDRRKLLKVIAVNLVMGGLVTETAVAGPKNFTAKPLGRTVPASAIPKASAWLITDPMLCVGCKTCEMVCAIVRDDGREPPVPRIRVQSEPFGSMARVHVMAEVCRQCPLPECYLACPHEALVIDRVRGTRVILPEKCVGCLECYEACPWDMIAYDRDMGKCTKCDLCGGDPQCVKYCPSGALKFVSLG